MGLVELTDEHILDMQLADEVIVMSLGEVPTPLRPGDRLSFPSFGCWTVLRSEPHPWVSSRVEVALRLHVPGDADLSRGAGTSQEQDGPAECSHGERAKA